MAVIMEKNQQAKKPLVSVVIPVFNGEKFVSDAVESAVQQDYENIEIIIVDDGSTDGTLAVLQKYAPHEKTRLLFHEGHENRGVSRSRKLGVDSSTGKYIAFLDADDMFLPSKISYQVSVLEARPDVVLCHGAIDPIYEENAPVSFEKHFLLSVDEYKYTYQSESYFLKDNRICNSTVLVRTEAMASVPFCAPQLFQYEDFLLWILLSEQGKFFFTPQKLLKYRYHPLSATGKAVANPLVSLYSGLELYFTLMTRVNEGSVRKKVLAMARKRIKEIIARYSCAAEDDENSEAVTDALRELFAGHACVDQMLYEENADELRKTLATIKNRLLWKTYSFIKKLRR